MGSRKKRKGPGRPKKNPAEVKSRTIQVRVTLEEHQALTQGAQVAGETLTAWLVGLGLRAAERAQKRR